MCIIIFVLILHLYFTSKQHICVYITTNTLYNVSTLNIIRAISNEILFSIITKRLKCVMYFYPALFAIQVED